MTSSSTLSFSGSAAPLFRPVTTDVRGERRFISTIARRLDSLGAITRGQREAQAGGLFRPEDNLESVYAKAALRLFYLALARGGVDGWTLERFETATGLPLLTGEGAPREDLPPMSRFLNRLLALPIDDQNALFAALELRIAAKVAEAVEGGVYEQGVETVRADFLVLESREAVFVHEASGAATELCAIARRDRLSPLTADEALPTHTESRLWLVSGLLLPLWDRLPTDSVRVRTLATPRHRRRRTTHRPDARGRAGPDAAHRPGARRGRRPHRRGGLRGRPRPRRRLPARQRLAARAPARDGRGPHQGRGAGDTDLPALKRLGCATEIVSWRTRVFVPRAAVLERLLDRWPLGDAADAA